MFIFIYLFLSSNWRIHSEVKNHSEIFKSTIAFVSEVSHLFSWINYEFLSHFIFSLNRYLVAFSGAIGLLNLVPCFALDGQYILAALLSVNKRESNQFINANQTKKPTLYLLIMSFGTILLCLNLICSMFNLFSSKIGSFFS